MVSLIQLDWIASWIVAENEIKRMRIELDRVNVEKLINSREHSFVSTELKKFIFLLWRWHRPCLRNEKCENKKKTQFSIDFHRTSMLTRINGTREKSHGPKIDTTYIETQTIFNIVGSMHEKHGQRTWKISVDDNTQSSGRNLVYFIYDEWCNANRWERKKIFAHLKQMVLICWRQRSARGFGNVIRTNDVMVTNDANVFSAQIQHEINWDRSCECVTIWWKCASSLSTTHRKKSGYRRIGCLI